MSMPATKKMMPSGEKLERDGNNDSQGCEHADCELVTIVADMKSAVERSTIDELRASVPGGRNRFDEIFLEYPHEKSTWEYASDFTNVAPDVARVRNRFIEAVPDHDHRFQLLTHAVCLNARYALLDQGDLQQHLRMRILRFVDAWVNGLLQIVQDLMDFIGWKSFVDNIIDYPETAESKKQAKRLEDNVNLGAWIRDVQSAALQLRMAYLLRREKTTPVPCIKLRPAFYQQWNDVKGFDDVFSEMKQRIRPRFKMGCVAWICIRIILDQFINLYKLDGMLTYMSKHACPHA
eukprot:Lithocolla_globosa_v1_NODE_35_length_8531_cov_41.341199.p3 type:complete len:292 gc:universal NODE_35_length_8531_cov_41.341199:6176-7051(+)